MFRFFRQLFQRKPTHGLPTEIKGHWYCGEWYSYVANLRDRGEYSGTTLDPDDVSFPPPDGRVAFNPFRCGLVWRNDNDGLIDGLIPACQKDGQLGLYEQVGNKYRDTPFYDGASWDDGYKIDLRLVKCRAVANEDD